MTAEYAHEKLQNAVLTLASGNMPLRVRLEDAYVSSLMRVRPEHDFPWPDVRQRFEDLMHDMAPNGHFSTALSMWPDEDLRRIVEGIVSLADHISRRLPRLTGE